MLDHPAAGPWVLWSRRACIGDTVASMGSEGRFVLREDAPYHLFAGDETAAVAFGAMLRALPASAAVQGVILAGGPGDRLPLAQSDRLTRIYRPDELLGGIRSLDLPDEPGAAYVAGEARTCQAVRGHLVGGTRLVAPRRRDEAILGGGTARSSFVTAGQAGEGVMPSIRPLDMPARCRA
ncbi:siderophore-interacting protein [Nonomuraea dietziae]|uniref:siderophore-interacting protein n=1 Tax=Nonomuraea dietziae TaxID=65515 RepID=UPI003F4D2343